MTPRTRWILAGAIALVVVGVLLFVFWPRAMAIHDGDASPAPVETSAAPIAEQAQAQLDALLTACAESTAATAPEHCGISIPWGTEFASVSSIRFRIETMPTLTVDGDAFTTDGGVLVATVDGTGHDGAPRTQTYRTDDWAVRGDVHVVDGVAAVTVW